MILVGLVLVSLRQRRPQVLLGEESHQRGEEGDIRETRASLDSGKEGGDEDGVEGEVS